MWLQHINIPDHSITPSIPQFLSKSNKKLLFCLLQKSNKKCVFFVSIKNKIKIKNFTITTKWKILICITWMEYINVSHTICLVRDTWVWVYLCGPPSSRIVSHFVIVYLYYNRVLRWDWWRCCRMILLLLL